MNISEKIIDLCKEIQQISAPTFQEQERAIFIRDIFLEEGLDEVSMDQVGNVYGLIKGRVDEKFIVLSAHLDTVFPSETDLNYKVDGNKIYGPGIGDNSLGVAGLFGLLWMIQEEDIKLPGGIWLVANVCEEGLGDLKGMREVVNRFGGDSSAYLILEGTAYKQIYNQGLGVKRYEIKVSTEGGHSWGDYGKPSAIHEIANLITKITSFELPSNPRTSLNVGIIDGGTSINTIAPEARFEIDLRSEGSKELKDLASKVEELVKAKEKDGVVFSNIVIGDRPSGKISEDHVLVNIAKDAIISLGDEPLCSIGSTDANIPLSMGFPAITIGLTTGGGVHTIHEYIDIPPLKKGMKQLFDIVNNIWSI